MNPHKRRFWRPYQILNPQPLKPETCNPPPPSPGEGCGPSGFGLDWIGLDTGGGWAQEEKKKPQEEMVHKTPMKKEGGKSHEKHGS